MREGGARWRIRKEEPVKGEGRRNQVEMIEGGKVKGNGRRSQVKDERRRNQVKDERTSYQVNYGTRRNQVKD